MDLREQLQLTLGDTYKLEGEIGSGGMSRIGKESEDVTRANENVSALKAQLGDLEAPRLGQCGVRNPERAGHTDERGSEK